MTEAEEWLDQIIERVTEISGTSKDIFRQLVYEGFKEGYKQCELDNDLATAQEVYDNTEVKKK